MFALVFYVQKVNKNYTKSKYVENSLEKRSKKEYNLICIGMKFHIDSSFIDRRKLYV